MDRQRRSTKNAGWALIAQSLILISQFAVQTVFVHQLSASDLGANGLFTNLISLLSFAELGVGTAITYALYAPIAHHQFEQVNAIMQLFRRVYQLVGIVILLGGLGLSTAINQLVKTGQSIPHLQGLFILALLATVVTYFFTYTRSLVIAMQDGYLDSRNKLIFWLLQAGLQITVLLTTHQFGWYLSIAIVTNLCANIRITLVAKRRYPTLKLRGRARVVPATLRVIKKNVVGMIANKVGDVVVFGTDNLLISKFVGLAAVGRYANYTLIITGINSVVGQGLNALVASFGNLAATSQAKHQEHVFAAYLYLVAGITFVLATTFAGLVQAFVRLWFGPHLLLATPIVLLITINFCLTALRQASLGFLAAKGLFWPMRYKALLEAAVNLGLSLVLMIWGRLGILGVLLGTLGSTVSVCLWWEPWVLYHAGFHLKGRQFAVKYGAYLLFDVSLLPLVLWGSQFVPLTNLRMVLGYGIGLLIGSVGLFLGVFGHFWEWHYLKPILAGQLKQLLK